MMKLLIQLILTFGICAVRDIVHVSGSFLEAHGTPLKDLDFPEWRLQVCPSVHSYACPSTVHPGKDLLCIDKDWLCDLDPDCPEGEDEDTHEGGPCHGKNVEECSDEDSFQCKSDSICFPKEWMCDGDLDCDDGSDEDKDNCPHTRNLIPCLQNQFQCDETFKCIPLDKICDGEYDCDSGLDETSCKGTLCNNVHKNCEKCVDVPHEARCVCGEMKYWNENTTSCVDLDECKYEQFCDQPIKCANKENGYTCDCVEGYKLEGKTSCKAQNDPTTDPAVLIMIDEWKFYVIDIEGNSSKSYGDLGQVRALSFLHAQGNVSWISHNSSSGKSYLMSARLANFEATKAAVSVNVELSTVDAIAIDWYHDNRYFADHVLKRVSVCTPDGQYCAIVAGGKDAALPLAGPRSIVLDPAEGYMYFTDWNSTFAQIVRCDMDGTDCIAFVSDSLHKPSGITIDYANKHLYWSDMQLRVIERIDLSGDPKSRRLIAIGIKVEHVHSLDVFENYLYLSNRHNNTAVRIHRYDYGDPLKTYLKLVSRPAQIYVYHKQRQPEGTSTCNAGSCKDTNHICVPGKVNEELQAKCLCAAGYKETAEGVCIAISDCADVCVDKNCSLSQETTASLPQQCTLAICPAKMSYCSMSDTCLPTSWWCNREVDCPNQEDEGPLCKYNDCLVSEYRCASGRCIDMMYKCDKMDDCGDGSDEDGCTYLGCEEGDDCPKCEDEDLFQCKEDLYMCIPQVFKCNGFPDCFNGSDEEGCDENTHPVMNCTRGVDFTCKDGQCISLAWRCDGELDCDDGSDEGRFCGNSQAECKDNERKCDTGNRCIPLGWFCDNEYDCIDRSDELDKNCKNRTHACVSPNRLCAKSGTHLCLKPNQLCDGVADCDNDEDEGGSCAAKACIMKPCSDICYNTPDGYVCACPTGQKLDADKKTCIGAVPVDKLCEQWGVCGQQCELDPQNTAIGYRCTCLDGFFLEPDGFTCKPLESDPVYVVFSNRHELRRVDIISSNAVTLKSGLQNTIAIDFYYKDGLAHIFWTDVMEDKIYKGVMMGNSLTDVEAIITSGLATTEGVAVDWVGENIYWVESNLDQIEVAKLDGSNRTTLIAGNMSSPRAIVVDPTVGWLFWTDWDGHNPRIERSSMSGDHRSVIHQIRPEEGGGWPNGLTTDYDFDRVYWIDARSESIHTINYDGKDHKLILKGNKFMSHPFALSLFGNYVYLTDWNTNSVVRANKFNGSDVQVIQKTITQPFDLQVIHPKRHPYMKNPCEENNGGCSDLCLINVNNTIGCRCPHRKRLKADGKTCEDDIKFLLFVKDHEIRGVDFDKADFNVIPVITIPHVLNPTAIDYDITSGTLYWADKGLKVINKANFNAKVETLIDGLENPEGFAIDWLSENMYFSSYNTATKKASISVATLAGSFRTEIISEGISQPSSLALHPLKGLLFFMDIEGETHKLFKFNMDASEPKLLFGDLNQPKSLSVDLTNDRLYFINSGNNTIISCDIDGKNKRVVSSVNISNPEALTVYRDMLYVSTEKQIVSIKTDGTGFVKLRDATPDVKALLPYDVDNRNKATSGQESNTCHGSQNKCTQLCLPKSQMLSQCKCTDGYDLNADQSTCIGITSFLLYAKETEIRGQKFAPKSTLEALPPISNIQSASAVDFHAELDMIYWVDNKANTISRIKRDLTQRKVIVRDGINSVEGIAVDWIAGNIYWTDVGHSIIEMSKLDGSNRYVITNGDMEKPRSIVVHPELGYMYWSDWGTDARIERARLDGSERAHYVFTQIKKPWGLTIDYGRHVLYWCDNELQTISRIDLLSDVRKVLIESSKDFQLRPISLTIFEEHIFWIDSNLDNGSGSIYRAAKVDGGNVTLIRSKLDKNLKDLKAFDVTRQIAENPCMHNNGGCQELCFYLGNENIRCDCSYGKLTPDKKTCTAYNGFIMFSKVTEIDSVNLEDLDNMNPPVKHITNDTHMRNVIGLAYDYDKKHIFFSDIQRGDIQKVDFDGKGVQVIVNGIGSAEGLAYENVLGDLYWTSYTNSCISKINVDDALQNRTRTSNVVIQLSKLDHPRAIVVDSCWKLIYWTNWNNEKPRIQRSNLDGTNDENIIVKDILTPNGLAIDHIAKKLYWSDARLDRIERCDMDGSNRHILLTAIPQHSFGLAVYGDYLFWTDWMLRAIIKVNKYDGTGIVWLRKNLERQPMGIIAVAEDSNDCRLNNCHENNGGCQDKCSTDLEGKVICQCRYGRLKADGKSCAALYNCSGVGYEAFSCLSGNCIHFQKSCDGKLDCPDGSDEFGQVCANRECPPSMFACENRTTGQCIALSKKCDRKVDCHDGSDESLSICDCPDSFFRCKSGGCIPKQLRCNDIPDCHDASDEIGCDAFKPCKTGFVSCNTTSDCIPKEKVCDGKPDCANGTDEPETCKEVKCGDNMFACDNKKECIYENWRCDKDQDCSDNSDEANCTYTCKVNQFQCAGDGTCISENWRCDLHDDCTDRSDEVGCEHLNCTDKFPCNEKYCIMESWKCDGEPDCPDGRDESNEFAGCAPVKCGINEFECANYRCVDRDYYCDKHDDCGDNSDEPKTCRPHPRVCRSNQFECSDHSCIDEALKCNGEVNCSDGSDELNCPCADKFACDNGVCINMTLVCNWEDDCGDNSDEPTICAFNECNLNHPCSQLCVDKPIGFECQCHPGYKLRPDNQTCEDVNECETEHPCSHYCVNTIGSYYCKCAEHYELGIDRRGCVLVNDQGKPYLLLSNRHHIRNMSFDGNNEALVSNLTYSVAIDFDYKEKMLYWTDILSQSSTINRIPLSNAKNASHAKEVLHSSTVLNPDGMAVDWIGRNLYWCDRNTDTVEVSKLDGRYRKILVRDKSFLREPRALELFPKYGYLYLTDWGDDPHISRISMDGKKKEHIITDEVAWPNALTIDYITEKIFWADANYDYIAMADMDGKNRRVIISEHLPHTFAITTFMDYIFWTDWESNGVYQAEKFTGEKRTLLRAMSLRPMDIVVFHSLRQPMLKVDPCEDLNCSHLCLLRPAKDGKDGSYASAVCACPENHKLNADNKTCTDDCTSSQFLCKGSSKCIPEWWYCDNHTDCDDGSDEPANCPQYFCQQPGLYQCKNATSEEHCIPPIGICDGKTQCADSSDETEWNNCKDYQCLSHQFKCGSKAKCISDSRVCDGQTDCEDGTDEQNCTVGQQVCLETQFQCNSTKKCIAYLWQCDGENDCLDWSDEKDCKNRTCKKDFLKCEKSQKCIPNQWECDGEHDCGADDDTDEREDHCSTVTCDPGSFNCQNSHCIPLRWRCDGDFDCSNKKDENDCPSKNCTTEEFQCDDKKKCISKSSQCNGLNDCRDGTDELDCPNTTCSAGYFQCKSLPRCIPITFKCDGHQQCMDGSDEENCQTQCSVNEFMCKNSTKCMTMQWRCDGDYDCADKSDEEDCYKYACQYGRFRCNNHVCIPLYLVCDGRPDCSSQEDESSSLCDSTQTECDLGQYTCKKDRKCISVNKVCDGNRDCVEGDDENEEELCHADNGGSCGLDNGGCSDSCTYLKSLKMRKCLCPPGQILDVNEVSCILDDPCRKWKTCSQQCIKLSNQNIHCSCEAGYRLVQKDSGIGCYAEGDKPELLIAWESHIQQHRIHDSSTEAKNEISKSPYLVESVDIDMSANSSDDWLLFVSYGGPGQITKVPLKDTNMPTLRKDLEKPIRNTREADEQVLINNGRPQQIAVDWIAKNLYWTDTQDKSIRMSNYDGQRVITVVKGHVTDPFDIVVDPNLGKIFWTDHGYPPTVESANLDGKNRSVLVRFPLLWPNGLALDSPNNRLYWADTKLYVVETIRTDGTDRHIVKRFDATDPPYKVEVFEELLYVTLAKSNRIAKFPKFFDETKHNVTFISEPSLPISDIVIIQENKQTIKDPDRTNACAVPNRCMETQLCINNPTVTGNGSYTCVCPDRSKANQTKCDFLICPDNYCNTGSCFVTYMATFQCSCPRGFTGTHCETDICENYCFSGGQCNVSVEDPPQPKCQCPPGFSGPRCTIYSCSGYCHNGGVCNVTADNKPICSCRFGYSGDRCEDHTKCDSSHCENNGTCTLRRGQLYCHCPPGFMGVRCEQCGLQDAIHLCANGGVCTKDTPSSDPRCNCRPGYDPQDHCQTRTCKNYCENNAECSLVHNRHECICRAGFEGPRCEKKIQECSKGYCLNGGTCRNDNTINHVLCNCAKGYYGSRCENILNLCYSFCKNGGNCTLSGNVPYCTCPEMYKGATCDECTCGPYGQCVKDTSGRTSCKCTNNLYEGKHCNRSICHDWCYNDAKCIRCHVVDNNVTIIGECEECRCKEHTSGARCNVMEPRQQEEKSHSVLIPVLVSIILALFVLAAVILFIFIKKKRSGQFRHSRLKDGSNMQVSNPIYMPQTTEDNEDEDDSHQPLDQPYDFDPEKSTNFANPVYEQFFANDSRQQLLTQEESDEEATEKERR